MSDVRLSGYLTGVVFHTKNGTSQWRTTLQELSFCFPLAVLSGVVGPPPAAALHRVMPIGIHGNPALPRCKGENPPLQSGARVTLA